MRRPASRVPDRAAPTGFTNPRNIRWPRGPAPAWTRRSRGRLRKRASFPFSDTRGALTLRPRGTLSGSRGISVCPYDWLPADVPVRETETLVLGSLLLDRRTRDAARPLLATHPTTATDVLRLPHVRSGGETDLVELRRFRSLPHPLRRRLLSVLTLRLSSAAGP